MPITISEDCTVEGDCNQCPLGGDNKDCKACAYYPEFEWNNVAQDCIKINLGD